MKKHISIIINIQYKIGYFFKNIKLLSLALTHCSASIIHNQRLEFLGDSVLNNIISLILYKKFPNLNEGNLSCIRSILVKTTTLAKIAKKLEINKYLNLGPGELKSNGNNKSSILANTIEAIIGAMYLDSNNILLIEQILLKWFKEYFLLGSKINEKDPKTKLQEFLQSYNLKLPIYKVKKIKIDNNINKQYFYIECIVPKINCIILTKDNSIKKAEQKAALKALNILKKTNI